MGNNTYTPLGQPKEITDARGYVTKYSYDDLGRPKTVTSPPVQIDNGSGTPQTKELVTTYAYDGNNAGGSVFSSTPLQPTSTIDARGYSNIIVYDKLYRPVEIRKEYEPGIFSIAKTDYDLVGNAIRNINALGHITEITYDSLNRQTAITALPGTAEATTNSTDYTSIGLAWRITDEMGRSTLYEHDSAGRKIKMTLPAVEAGTPVVLNEYDFNANLTASTDPQGNRTEFVYDALNRRTWAILPEMLDTEKNVYAHPIIKTEYDEVGNVIKVTDPRGFVTETEYDSANRAIKTISPKVSVLNNPTLATEEGRLTATTKYDPSGNAIEVTDAKGNILRNSYDAINRLIATTDAENITVAFRYNETANKTIVIDGKGNTTRFTYDGMGRTTKITDPAGATVTYGYNELYKTSRIDSQNRVTTYTYDNHNRLKTTIYSSRPQDNLVYTYDLVGNILSATTPNDPSGTRDVAYTYNNLNNAITETVGCGGAALTHRYYYDLGGNRIKTLYGGTGRALETTYDSNNRVATISEGERLTKYTYDRSGNLIKKQLSNGVVAATVFDPLNRAQSVTTKSGLTTLQAFGYNYDANSSVTRIVETYQDNTKNRIVENTYDKISRLICETIGGAGAMTTSYTFDNANNRETKTSKGVTTTYTYNNLNQLTSHTDNTGTKSYSYDADGNRRNRTNGANVTTYTYDQENRLVGVVQDGATYAYAYDYRTRRVQRNEGAEQVRIVYSGGTSCAEYTTPATIPTVEYIRGSDFGGGIGGILYSLRAGAPSYAHYNSRGDVTAKTDDSGAITYQALYEAYGKRPVETGINLDRQRANTKDEDPTGLLNEGFRYRDLETGSFITRDPLGFIDGPNMYAYVVQNPWSKFDPRGLFGTTVTTLEFKQYMAVDAAHRAGGEMAAKREEERYDFAIKFNMDALGSLALTAIPGVGEYQDAEILHDPESYGWERMVALGSLAASGPSEGTSPNAGPVIKKIRELRAMLKGESHTALAAEKKIAKEVVANISSLPASSAKATFEAATEETVKVYRGVHAGHPGHAEAIQGIVTPWGGHNDPIRHNRGDNRSNFTSWTTDKNQAIQFALQEGPGGVLLEQTVSKSHLIKSIDELGELEYLRLNKIENAKSIILHTQQL